MNEERNKASDEGKKNNQIKRSDGREKFPSKKITRVKGKSKREKTKQEGE